MWVSAASLGRGRDIGEVNRENAFKNVACLVKISPLCDHQVHVLLAAAGDPDVQTSTRRRWRHEFVADRHGGGLVAVLGSGVAEPDMLSGVFVRECDAAVSQM